MNNSTEFNTKSNVPFHESSHSQMDKKLPKKSPFQKYKYYLLGGVIFAAFLIYVLINVSGGRKLRIDNEKITIADVAEDKFLDYVDAEGIVQPILTIKLNAMEAGMVRQIVAEEGAMLKKDDVILELQNPDLERVI